MLTDEGNRWTFCAALGVDVGAHHFGKSSKGIFDQYGLGIQLYFKFLKSLMFMMIFLTILSIPMIKTNIECIF